jgi:hypothetical protein
MATPGQLVDCIATALSLPKPTVALYDRLLSEAGYRSKAGRGRGSAHVTVEDAANLLIAIAGAPATGASINAAVSTVEHVAGMKYDRVGEMDHYNLLGLKGKERKNPRARVPGLCTLPDAHSFRDALTATIEAFREQKLPARPLPADPFDADVGLALAASVDLEGASSVCTVCILGFSLKDGSFRAWYRPAREEINTLGSDFKWSRGSDFKWSRRFSGRTLAAVAALLGDAGDKGGAA